MVFLSADSFDRMGLWARSEDLMIQSLEAIKKSFGEHTAQHTNFNILSCQLSDFITQLGFLSIEADS